MACEEELFLRWDQAGERPYDVFSTTEMAEFLQHLNEQHVVTLYRGTRRHQALGPGDVLDYTYPTSWSSARHIAQYFIDGCNGTLLVLKMAAVYGKYNLHGRNKEDEFIMRPTKLIVDRTKNNSDHVVHYMRPI